MAGAVKAYVGGPMTGRPSFNFPAFDAVSAMLRRQGWEVFNPHEHDQEIYPGIDSAQATLVGDVQGIAEEVGFSFADAMTWDLARVVEADAIVLLPEWETSTGAKAERFVAEMTGKDVWLAFQYEAGQWDVSLDDVQKRLSGPSIEIRSSGPEGNRTPDQLGSNVPLGQTTSSPEIRVVDPVTGGAKGSKLARYELIPEDTMEALAEHYGRGAGKYEDRNWEKGYAWSLSYAALRRHLGRWWQLGEDIDPEGFHHSIAVLWHATALSTFALREIGTDDRPKTALPRTA